MKTSKALTALLALIFSCLISLGAVGCMTSAFSIPLESPQNLALFCVLASLFCAGAYSFRRGGLLVLLAALAGGLYLYHIGGFFQSLFQLVYRISHFYDAAYHWGVLKLVDTPWDAGTADLPMLVLSFLLATLTARSVCRGSGILPPMLLSLLCLFSCVVVTDTVPAPEPLYLLLLGWFLLLITANARKDDRSQGDRLSLLALIPAALTLALLFTLLPRENYVDPTAALRDKLLHHLETLPEKVTSLAQESETPTPAHEPAAVNLSTLGRRRESTIPVLYVEAQTGGPLYLRGQDYDHYDGKSWHASENRVETFAASGPNLGYVVIESRQIQDRLYLPYYPRDGLSLIGGQYENLRISDTYSFLRQDLPENWSDPSSSVGPPAASDGRYLTLPEAAQAEALSLLSTLDLAGDTPSRAQTIAAYVRDSARYSLDPSRMPEDAEDFALWFLQESDTGYCVHFATAATVLLRAAGIEARYVSGYLVSAAPAETVAVTGEHAHAWAEYYLPGLNTWVPLEATPSDGLPAPPGTQPPETMPQNQMTEAPEAPTTTPEPESPPPSQSPAATVPTVPATVPETPVSVPEPTPSHPSRFLSHFLGWASALLLIELQRRLRLALTRRLRTHGTPNRRALSLWHETERFAKHLKESPPDTLEFLAQKAKFSQHTLGKEEISQFTAYLADAQRRLMKRPLYRKLLDRYLFVLY